MSKDAGRTGEPLTGVVGLGGVGWAAAQSLIKNGEPVLGYQRKGAEQLVAAGGQEATSEHEVFDRCSVVLLALPTGEALVDVVESTVRDRRRAPGGAVGVDLSAVDLAAKHRARSLLADAGISLLDAPVSGSPGPDTPTEFAGLFASGEESTYRSVQPVLQLLASRVWYLGEFGAGTRMKLINLAVVAMHTVVAAEALQLGIRAGVQKDTLFDVLTHSPSSSWVLHDRGRRMLDGPHSPPRGSIQAMHDILLRVEAMAERIQHGAPLLHRTAQRLGEAIDQGMGDEDSTAMYRLL